MNREEKISLLKRISEGKTTILEGKLKILRLLRTKLGLLEEETNRIWSDEEVKNFEKKFKYIDYLIIYITIIGEDV
jgi:hypothetical protein